LNTRQFLKHRYLHALAKFATAEGFELQSLSVGLDAFRWAIRKCLKCIRSGNEHKKVKKGSNYRTMVGHWGRNISGGKVTSVGEAKIDN